MKRPHVSLEMRSAALRAEMLRIAERDDALYGYRDNLDAYTAEQDECYARASLHMPQPPRNAQGLRTDGPTIEQWVAAGYWAEHYPPQGYAATLVPCVIHD